MLGVIKLSVIVLNGVRLSVVAPSVLQLNVTLKEIEKKFIPTFETFQSLKKLFANFYNHYLGRSALSKQ
jgi:hypothetical protein